MANSEILSSAVFKPQRNSAMASTGAFTQRADNYLVPHSSAVVTTAVGAYFDAGSTKHIDFSKFVLMYGATDTAFFYVRTDVSAFSGANVGVRTTGPGTGSTELLKGIKLGTTGASTAGLVYMAGPFETHLFKDSDGHINFEKTTEAGSTTQVFLTPILLP